ncbi:MAG: hypothetical protein AAF500_21020 [Myxococcota bacterium]
MLRMNFRSVVTLGLVLLLGCAAAQERSTLDSERNLAAAGFEMRLADTPAKLTQLQTLPQHEILPRSSNGQTYFMYADATDCKCLYVGNQSAYQEYAKLTQQEEVAKERMEAAEAWDDAAWGPWVGAWGAWGPYW